jgi:hypothetical protein
MTYLDSQAGGTVGVTLHTPPKGDLFVAFHSEASLRSVPAQVPTSTPTPALTPFGPGMFNPYAFMTPPPWMIHPGMPSYPTTPTPHSAHGNSGLLSSDPPDDSGANPYPEIRPFLEKLDQRHPRRSLLLHAYQFEQKDFYNIDEIVNLSMECLTATEFGLSFGNAQFLVNAAKAEIKRIDRSLGKRLR